VDLTNIRWNVIVDVVNLQCFSLKQGGVTNVSFHGKRYINAFPFNASKHLLVTCLPLKWFRKLLEALNHLLKVLFSRFTTLEICSKLFHCQLKALVKLFNFPFNGVSKVAKSKR